MSEQEMISGLSEMGFTPQQLQSVLRGARSLPEAKERLESIKADVRRAFKRKALELHPDRTGGDLEKEKLVQEAPACRRGVWEDPDPGAAAATTTTIRAGGSCAWRIHEFDDNLDLDGLVDLWK